jgi:SAM-dependent methyltransferase/uncharacterized membrane protein YbhN (UPF0104 family)
MARRRLLLLTLALGAVGAAIASGWLLASGGAAAFRPLGRARPIWLMALLGATLGQLGLRFLGWQFLLRRAEVRIPERRSLGIYLASLPGMATPAYVGEALRAVFARRAFGVPVRTTLAVLVLARLLDVASLLAVGALAVPAWRGALPVALGATGLVALALAARGVARAAGVSPAVLAGLSRGASLGYGMAFALGAWLLASLTLPLAARALGALLAPLTGMGVFAKATLVGGLTLMPAGVGATGSAAILALQRLHVPLVEAVAVVTLFRLATTGFALSLGGVFLGVELARQRRRPPAAAPAHFDTIADHYCAQYAPHVWELLLRRRTDRLARALGPPDGAGRGLDLGCGLGHQALELERRGYRVVGLDASAGLVRAARDAGVRAVSGDALRLPFRDGSLDFVYTVGVLHHLGGAAAQDAARREVTRVLRPGGCLVVQETNTRNPLFRFYMVYVFPLLKTIDEGTERWIPPAEWEGLERLRLAELRYFTFLPDFVPRVLLEPLVALERRLEASRLAPLAVHYQAVLRRS